ncbi:MAG: lactonase family protein [Planctomycetia bacterium]|nr:lactonase family protein [Planctomycetia bacterium]
MLTLGAAGGFAQGDKAGKMRVYIGTYTGKESKGIYLLELDLATGTLTEKGLAGESVNPSFLAIHPSQKYLYAANEVGSFEGKKGGAVTAFAIDAATGKLTELNKQSSGGSGPCHIVVDKEGKVVLVANYGGGSVASLSVEADGKLKEAASVIQHTGSSVDPGRQKAPHAHSINVDPGNRFAMAADLGLDKVLIYKLDPAKGTLTPNDPPSASVAGGSGPRHFAFHPDGKHAYVINEMKSTMTAFSYDAAKGELKEIQTLSTLPADHKGGNSTAEVVVHPSGKFVYGSNRGHDSIAIFAVEADGKLKAVGHEPTQGKTPRNFNVDPTGQFLLAANQNSGTVVVFRIDPATGQLKATGSTAKVPGAVCVRFVPVK